jgi:hypothetical protein
MELLLPWATAAAAAAAAANRRRKAAADGAGQAASSATSSKGGNLHRDVDCDQGNAVEATQTAAGLKAATGADVLTAEKAAAKRYTAAAAAPAAAPASHPPGGLLPGVDVDEQQLLSELARPRYDAFTDFWDMSRDMG